MKNPVRKMISGANAARKATFTDKSGIGLTEAQVKSMIRSGASLDGIIVSNDISLTTLAEMLDGSGADRDEIMKSAYAAAFAAAGHSDAEAMATEVVNGTDIAEVVRRHATHDVVIKSGRVEFDSAEEARVHVDGLTKEGKKAFFAGLKTVVKVNGIEEDEVPLGDFFKKYMPATAATDPDPDEPDDNIPTDDAVTAATEMPSGRALILVGENVNIGDNDEVKLFAANLTVYGESNAIKAITSGKAATVKAIKTVEGVKTADKNFFSHGVVKFIRHRNELAEDLSIFNKSKKSKKKDDKNDKNDED